MKHDWEYKQIMDVGKVVTGSTPSTSDKQNYTSNDVCFVKPSDIGQDGITEIQETEYHISEYAYNNTNRKLPRGSVLVTCIGIIGKVGILTKEATCNQQINAVIPNNTIMPRYLAYSLYSIRKALQDKANAPVVPILNKGQFSSFQIPVPPLSVQEHICSLLDNLNLVIEKKKEQIAELDNLAQSLFFDIFGDILETDPTRCLKDVAEYYIGLTYSPDDVAQEGCIVLRSSNIQNNVLDFNDTVRVKSTISDKKKVRDGDILMCARNGSARLVGKVARIRNISEEMSFGAFMTIIRSQYNDFLFHFFLSHYFRDQLTTSKTATINQITTKMLDGIKLNVPPLPLQQAFAEKVKAIERQKELINQSIKDVQTLFDAKMDYYFGD